MPRERGQTVDPPYDLITLSIKQLRYLLSLDTSVAKGAIIQIGPLDVYESKPPELTAHAPLLLLLPDGFGLVKHNFLLADAFAARGWRVLIPDYFEGV